MITLDFGKHKGLDFYQTPKNYQEWLYSQDFFQAKLTEQRKKQTFLVLEDFQDFNCDGRGNFIVKKGTILRWEKQYLSWTYYKNENNETVIIRGWFNNVKLELVNE